MHGVFLDKLSLDRNDLDFTALEQVLPNWRFYDHTAAGEVSTRIKEAQVVICNKVILDAEILASASNLKLVCIAATGTNNVDLAAATRLGITVCNVRGYGTPSVVQHVFMLMLMLLRNYPRYQQAVAAGDWQRSDQFCLLDYTLEELTGKTLGIVGYGELGKAVAAMASAFGMQVLIAQRAGTTESGADRLPLHELLPRVDVLSLHCPLTDETRDLIAQAEFRLLPKHAIVINTARGGIVNEAALLQALQQGEIAGAATDVLVVEPPANDSLLLQQQLANLIITPHIAWASRQARQRLLDQVAENIRLFNLGQPQNRVC